MKFHTQASNYEIHEHKFTREYLNHAHLWSNVQTATIKYHHEITNLLKTQRYCPLKITAYTVIDNHNSGALYSIPLDLPMQLYVETYLGHHHILAQKEYSPKLMAQPKSTPLFTYRCSYKLNF